MTTMQLELPLFIYAAQLNVSYSVNVTVLGQDCNGFYSSNLFFPQEATDALCNDATNTFNWVKGPGTEGYFKTALALLSGYFYELNFNTANANYYELFLNLTQWSPFMVDTYLFNDDSPVSAMVDL